MQRHSRSDAAPLAPHEITSEEVAHRLGVQMRKMVGPGRRWSYKGLSELTGIDQRSLQAYATGIACPNLAKFKRLLAVLGPELARDIDRMFGWSPRELHLPPGALDLDALRNNLVVTLAQVDRILSQQS